MNLDDLNKAQQLNYLGSWGGYYPNYYQPYCPQCSRCPGCGRPYQQNFRNIC